MESEVSSALPGCSAWESKESYGVIKFRKKSTETPQVGSSTRAMAISPEWHDDSSSASSFTNFPLEKSWCYDCHKEAEEMCRKRHIIQNLKCAREREAADEIRALESLMEARVVNLEYLTFLNNEVMNRLFANSEVFVKLSTEVRETLTKLKECISADCEASSWEEARHRAQMLLAKGCTQGQDVRSLEDKRASLFIRTSGGHCWLGNDIELGQNPILIAAIIESVQRGVLEPVSPQDEAATPEDEASQECAPMETEGPLLSNVVKDETESQPVESTSWHSNVDPQVEGDGRTETPCSGGGDAGSQALSGEIRPKPKLRTEIPFDSLSLDPLGGRGRRHGRKGLHRTKRRHPNRSNSIFHPSLRGVGRRAGARRIVGLEYPENVKCPTKKAPGALDVEWLVSSKDNRRKKEALLRSPKPVRELTGVYCHKDPSFVSNLLWMHADRLETLVLYAVQPKHLCLALEMPRLRKLNVWTLDRARLANKFNPPKQVVARHLRWMEVNLPREMVRRLLTAVAPSLRKLLLWVGTPGPASSAGASASNSSPRDKWPQCCYTLDALFVKCGPLPELREVTLMRNKAWCHSEGACRQQLGTVRAVLPRAAVLCDVCDANAPGLADAGTFSQGSFADELSAGGGSSTSSCSGDDSDDSGR